MRLVFLFSFLALIATPLSLCGQRVTKVKRKGVKIINVTKPSTNTSSYSLKQLTGKWQEVSRKDRENNSAVDFTDTLLFHFYGDDNVSVRNGINLSVQGNADIQPGNILTTAGDEFIIKSIDKTRAVLDDEDKYIHTIIKTKSFWYETLPTDSIVAENFNTPIAVRLSNVAGKWAVYRRNAKPGATENDMPLIRKITIEDKTDNTSNGEITFYQVEKTETLPCFITVDGNKINIVTTKHSWQMDVYKVTEEEFIFGSPALMYYAKRY